MKKNVQINKRASGRKRTAGSLRRLAMRRVYEARAWKAVNIIGLTGRHAARWVKTATAMMMATWDYKQAKPHSDPSSATAKGNQ